MHKSHMEFANGYVSALTLYLIGSFRMVCVSKNVHAGSSLSNKISYRHIITFVPEELSISTAEFQGFIF